MSAEAKSNSKETKKIKLVDGSFTVAEASDVVLSLITEKINFHKLQRLSLSEGHVDANTDFPDTKIEELTQEKELARDYFNNLRQSGATIKINGTLEITIQE